MTETRLYTDCFARTFNPAPAGTGLGSVMVEHDPNKPGLQITLSLSRHSDTPCPHMEVCLSGKEARKIARDLMTVAKGLK